MVLSLQDMLLDKTSYEDKSPQDRALAKDVILDATKFGQSFEQILGRLSAFDTPESNTALTAGIEKMDILNNSLNLHKEVHMLMLHSHSFSQTQKDLLTFEQ